MKNSILWILFGCSAGFIIMYAAHMTAVGKPFTVEVLPLIIGTACTIYIILFILSNCRKKKEPIYIVFGRMMINAIWLNFYCGIDVYLCLQGNTGCICLTVEENKTVVYQNRSFLSNKDSIQKLLRDVQAMRRYKHRQRGHFI